MNIGLLTPLFYVFILLFIYKVWYRSEINILLKRMVASFSYVFLTLLAENI